MLVFTGLVNLHLKQEQRALKNALALLFTARALKEIGEPQY
jgi:hypothetical protein